MSNSGRPCVRFSLLVGLLLGSVNCTPGWDHDLGPIYVSADGQKLVVEDFTSRQNWFAPTVSIAESKRQVLVYDLGDLRAEPVRIEIASSDRNGIGTAPEDDSLMLALSGVNDSIALWSRLSGRHRAILHAGEESDRISALAFSPDGAVVAAGTYDGVLKLWDVESHDGLADQKECDAIYSVLFAPDGRLIVGCKEEIRIYRQPRLELISSFSAISNSSPTESTSYVNVRRLEISPKGDLLASSDSEGTIALWELRDGKEIPLHEPRLEIPADRGFSHPATALTFSPDGARVGAGGLETVKIWDISTRRPVLSFEAHGTSVDGIAFSPNGETLVTSSGCGGLILCTHGDNTIRIWEADTGRRIATLRP